MARICDFTGRKTKFGQTRSHSMSASKRTFKVNLLKKRVRLEDGSMMTVKISSKAYKKLKGFMLDV